MQTNQTEKKTYIKPVVTDLGRMHNFVQDQFDSYLADGGMAIIGMMKVLLTKPS